MKTRIEEIWNEIFESAKARPISTGSYVLRRIDPDFKFDVFAGVDSSGYVMLAVGISRTPPAIKIDSVSLDYFRQKRADESWLMALRLRQLALIEVFGRLCQDLLDATSVVADESELVELVRGRLNLWKKLFDGGSSGQLEPHQVKGLIAELLVLETTISIGKRLPLEAVNAWVGPSDADQDFQFSDEAIEVKAINPGSEGVSINSLQQLEYPHPIRLSLQTLRSASPGEEGALGLNDLVPRIEGLLAATPDALALFKGKLLQAQYVESPHYDTILFQALSSEEYLVTAEFPKLTVRSVPDGISAATYLLSLENIRNRG
jgi:hypothetical protein